MHFTKLFYNLLNNKFFYSGVLKQIYVHEKVEIEATISYYALNIEKMQKQLIDLQEQSNKNQKICQSTLEKINTKEIIMNQRLETLAREREEKYKEIRAGYEDNLTKKENELSESLKKYSTDISKLKAYNIIAKFVINIKLSKLKEQISEIEERKVRESWHALSRVKDEISDLERDIEKEKLNLDELNYTRHC